MQLLLRPDKCRAVHIALHYTPSCVRNCKAKNTEHNQFESKVMIKIMLKKETSRISVYNASLCVPHQAYSVFMTDQMAGISLNFAWKFFKRQLDTFYRQNATLQCRSKHRCSVTALWRHDSLTYVDSTAHLQTKRSIYVRFLIFYAIQCHNIHTNWHSLWTAE
jgi:hypothetical protein